MLPSLRIFTSTIRLAPRQFNSPIIQGPIIGVDLGTFNSRVAVLLDGKNVKIIENAEGTRAIPSYVTYTGEKIGKNTDKIFINESAKEYAEKWKPEKKRDSDSSNWWRKPADVKNLGSIMARKRRIQLTAEERNESEMYERKLRSCKQELPSLSTGLTDITATGEPLPSDTADIIYIPQQQELSIALARRIFQPPPPQLSEDDKQNYTFKTPYPQKFSIPENIVYYMTQKTTSYRFQRNLLKTCKLIFRMSQIVPVWGVENGLNNDVVLSGVRYTPLNTTYDTLKKLTIKFQIYGNIFVGNQSNPYHASALTQRIHKCSPAYLLIQYQNLTFGEIQILAGGNKLVKIVFTENIVKNADGSITEFEKIFEALLCVNMHFELPNENGIGKNTTKKMAELLEFKVDLCHLYVGDVPEIFDGQLFVRSLNPDICYLTCIKFSDTVSSAYKNQLGQFIDQFYGVHRRISFLGLDDDDIQV